MQTLLSTLSFIFTFSITTIYFVTSTQAQENQAKEDTDSIRWEQRTRSAIACVESLKSEKYLEASVLFTTEMKKEVTLSLLQNFWKQFLEKSGGSLSTVEKIEREMKNNVYWLYTVYKAKKGHWQFRIGYENEDSITAFHIDKYIYPPEVNKWRMPSYVSTDSTTTRELIINKGLDYESKAHVAINSWKSRTPVVILVHDAGPWDKDGSRYSNKPFADLAYGLATNGIGVIRIDKRTYAHQKKLQSLNETISPNFDTEQDVNEIIKEVLKKNRFDTSNIFLLGHGIGSNLVPRIMKNNPVIKGAILLAPYGRPLEDALFEEIEYVLSEDTLKSNEKYTKVINTLKKQVANLKSATFCLTTKTEDLPLETPASYWLDLKSFNPILTLKSLEKPAIILRGERDFRTSVLDFENWKKNLIGANMFSTQYTFISYPNLNNIFMEGKGKSSPYEYHEPKNMSKQVVDDISNWVWKIAKGK